MVIDCVDVRHKGFISAHSIAKSLRRSRVFPFSRASILSRQRES